MGRGRDVARRLRRHAVETALLVAGLVLLVRLDVVDGPGWLLAVVVVAGVVAISLAYAVWPGEAERSGLHAAPRSRPSRWPS